MRARIVIIAIGVLYVAACADRPFGPADDLPPEIVAPPISGSHLTQQFRISPIALDFGQVPVGTAAPEQFVVITNVGHGAVEMSGTGGAAGVFGGVQNCQGTTLAEGASCVMSYSFTPAAPGVVETTTSGTWNAQPFTIALRGEGIARHRFSITGTALDFGQIPVGATAPQQAVTVTNLGPGPVVMDGAGGAAGIFGGTQNCQGTTLAEGASCQMFYAFSPVSGGIASATASGTWNGQPYSIEMRGEGIQAQRFAMTPTAFDFGEVHVGGFSSLQVVNVTNLGPGPIVMNGTFGTPAGFLSMEMCQGVTLGEGQFCQMYFAFMPESTGDVNATSTGNWNGQPYSVALHGIGIAPGAPLTKRFLVSTRGLDFGAVDVGASSPSQIVTVTNLGPGAVVMSGTGGAAGVFGGTQNCQGMTLGEGSSCEMTYRFTPTQNGEATFVTNGTWNGEDFSISFRGYGTQRERFLITPTAHDFGSVAVGGSSAEHVIRVTNLGPGTVVMDGAGGAAAEFGGVQNCQGVALAEGASCEMLYQFAPTVPGEIVRTTSGSWNGQPFAFTFRGVGMQSDRFLISPTGFDFGEVELGTSAPEQMVTITNLGPGAVTMDGAGGAAGVFGGVQNCQGVTLAEGGTCTMSYSFTPTVAGLATEATSGTWNGQPFALSFRGTGVAPLTAAVQFGGFLPPLNWRLKVQPGSTLPVKARLLDASGALLSDAEAVALAEACGVVVTFSADPTQPLCGRYMADDRHFQVNLQIPRLVPLGKHRITVEVRSGGAVISTGVVEIEMRAR